MVAAPDLPGLCEEDIDDALEHAGLKSLNVYNLFGHLFATSAAWAGSALGMCSIYTDFYECEDEERHFTAHQALVLSFFRRAFGTSMSNMDVAHIDIVQASFIN